MSNNTQSVEQLAEASFLQWYGCNIMSEYDEAVNIGFNEGFEQGHAAASTSQQTFLDAYLALKAENERLLEANRWVPISELPKTDKGLWLVLTKSGKVKTGYMWPDRTWMVDYQGDTDYVTHYRPLPTPPTV